MWIDRAESVHVVHAREGASRGCLLDCSACPFGALLLLIEWLVSKKVWISNQRASSALVSLVVDHYPNMI